MTILSNERVRLQAEAADKAEAIRQAGTLLVDTGCVEQNYVSGMLAREETMSTYLGNGVAIPHGQYENRHEVHQTAISVVQIPNGVTWDDDETVYLVIGIAALSDEHMDVLANLAEVIEDEDLTAQLVNTDDPQLILKHLGASSNGVG